MRAQRCAGGAAGNKKRVCVLGDGTLRPALAATGSQDAAARSTLRGEQSRQQSQTEPAPAHWMPPVFDGALEPVTVMAWKW